MVECRKLRFWTAGAIVVAAACASKPPPERLTEGVWLSPSAGGPYDESVVELTVGEQGLGGVIYLFRAGKLESEMPLSNLRYDHPNLEFTAGAFPFEVRVDVEQGTMKGKSTNARGPRLEIDAERRDPATIPGLAAGDLDYSYRKPAQTEDGWPTATPEEVGLDRATLESLVRALVDGEGGLMHSLLLAKDGQLVLEEYFHGFGPDDLHMIQSCTKSVASLLVGLAIERGEIAGVDAPVLDYFPDLAAEAAPGWREVRLRHLLTMTAGLAWGADPTTRGSGETGPESFRRVLTREPVHPPGEVWEYAGPDVNLLAGVLRQATGLHADVYAAENLFAPLGITEYDWSTYGKREGYPNLAGSLLLRPRDMMKIGALVLGEGRWQGRQVVAADWIRASTRPQCDTGDEEVDDYGYLWWLMKRHPEDPAASIVAARGWGSQFILIVPAEQLIAVTTGGNSMNGRSFDVLGVLGRYLMPEAPE